MLGLQAWVATHVQAKNHSKSRVTAHNLGQIGGKRDRATEVCYGHIARSDGEADSHGVARRATSDDCPDGQCRSRMRRQDGLKCGQLLMWALIIFFLSSCSTFRHVALKTVAPVFWQGTRAFEREGDWHAFREGLPGNLKLIEGLLELRPEDPALLVALAKGYAGHSFAVHETLFLGDKLAEREFSRHRERAIAGYVKALTYGMRWLAGEGVSRTELLEAQRKNGGVAKLLKRRLGNGDLALEGVLYTAQALASVIALKKDDIALVGELPLAVALFDWVCGLRPRIAHGTCPLFYASYQVSRPKALGGDPPAGRRAFEDFIKRHPHHWLGRVLYLERDIIPAGDRARYLKQKSALEKFAVLHKKRFRWPLAPQVHPAFANSRLNLYQAIAVERFQIIERHARELF